MNQLPKDSLVRRVFLSVFALCAAALCMNSNLGAAPAAEVAKPVTGEAEIRPNGDEVGVSLRLGSHHRFGTTLPRRAVRELPDGSAEIRREAGTVHLLGGLSKTGKFTFTPSAEYQSGLADRGLYPDSPAGESLFELAMIDVTLDFIDDLAALSYRENLDKLTEMRIHGADARYVRSLQDVGLKGLPASRLVEMRIHGVRADDVEAWERLGLGTLPPERLVEMAIHGVDPAFVRDMKSLGYRNVPVARWTEMRIHGVDGDYVRQLAKNGVTGLSVGQLIERRIHGG